MSEIRLEFGRHDGGVMDANYWAADAVINGGVHTDAVGPTVELALAALAKKLADQIEGPYG